VIELLFEVEVPPISLAYLHKISHRFWVSKNEILHAFVWLFIPIEILDQQVKSNQMV
jgi:hypothetical protein